MSRPGSSATSSPVPAPRPRRGPARHPARPPLVEQGDRRPVPGIKTAGRPGPGRGRARYELPRASAVQVHGALRELQAADRPGEHQRPCRHRGFLARCAAPRTAREGNQTAVPATAAATLSPTGPVLALGCVGPPSLLSVPSPLPFCFDGTGPGLGVLAQVPGEPFLRLPRDGTDRRATAPHLPRAPPFGLRLLGPDSSLDALGASFFEPVRTELRPAPAGYPDFAFSARRQARRVTCVRVPLLSGPLGALAKLAEVPLIEPRAARRGRHHRRGRLPAQPRGASRTRISSQSGSATPAASRTAPGPRVVRRASARA